MTFSYSQISALLACPRRYRYQYLEGWQEKQTRAAMLFGRALEQALAAYFTGNDWQSHWYQDWWAVRESDGIAYGAGESWQQIESWQQMLRQGEELLQRFAREDRVRIAQPQENLQRRFMRRLDQRNDFVGHVDAIGTIDGQHCLIDWKSSGSCYPTQPTGLVALDPHQLPQALLWQGGNPDVLSLASMPLFALLPHEQQREFLQR